MDFVQGFKIVHRKWGTSILKSSVIQGDAAVVYVPGEAAEAQPKWAAQGYHLTAFLDLEAARDFARISGDELWTADLGGVFTELPPRMYLSSPEERQRIMARASSDWRSFAMRPERGDEDGEPLNPTGEVVEEMPPWPDGTVMAQVVILREQLSKKEGL